MAPLAATERKGREFSPYELGQYILLLDDMPAEGEKAAKMTAKDVRSVRHLQRQECILVGGFFDAFDSLCKQDASNAEAWRRLFYGWIRDVALLKSSSRQLAATIWFQALARGERTFCGELQFEWLLRKHLPLLVMGKPLLRWNRYVSKWTKSTDRNRLCTLAAALEPGAVVADAGAARGVLEKSPLLKEWEVCEGSAAEQRRIKPKRYMMFTCEGGPWLENTCKPLSDALHVMGFRNACGEISIVVLHAEGDLDEYLSKFNDLESETSCVLIIYVGHGRDDAVLVNGSGGGAISVKKFAEPFKTPAWIDSAKVFIFDMCASTDGSGEQFSFVHYAAEKGKELHNYAYLRTAVPGKPKSEQCVRDVFLEAMWRDEGDARSQPLSSLNDVLSEANQRLTKADDHQAYLIDSLRDFIPIK